MIKVKDFLKKEDGAAELIEAVIIYPVVFLCIAFLIYFGLYLLQNITLQTYARKTAMLAARELACPGYIDMFAGDKNEYSAYSDASVEGADNLLESIKINSNPKNTDVKPYRYMFSSDPISGHTKGLEKILKNMVENNSIIGAKKNVSVEVKSKNYFVVQYVDVSVEQELLDFPVLEYFGIENPKVSVTVEASANDTDEFIRNVDFVTDTLEYFAKKIGIDVNGIRDKIDEVKEKFNLN